MFFWKKKPTGKEIVDAVIAKYVTPEQMQKLENVLVQDQTLYDEIVDIVALMKARYSMEKSLEIAGEKMKWINLDDPTSWDRRSFGFLFFKTLLKG